MVIVWDERKRVANLATHGIDFADIGGDFFASAVVRPARGGRFAAFGTMTRPIAVIFLPLGDEGLSIVSARPAGRKERRLIP